MLVCPQHRVTLAESPISSKTAEQLLSSSSVCFKMFFWCLMSGTGQQIISFDEVEFLDVCLHTSILPTAHCHRRWNNCSQQSRRGERTSSSTEKGMGITPSTGRQLHVFRIDQTTVLSMLTLEVAEHRMVDVCILPQPLHKTVPCPFTGQKYSSIPPRPRPEYQSLHAWPNTDLQTL
jgi:hypothetical protein